MQRFDGRVALITGGSRGIGLAIAKRLVSEGAQVVITGRKQESLDAALAELNAIGGAAPAPERHAVPPPSPARPTTPSTAPPSSRTSPRTTAASTTS